MRILILASKSINENLRLINMVRNSCGFDNLHLSLLIINIDDPNNNYETYEDYSCDELIIVNIKNNFNIKSIFKFLKTFIKDKNYNTIFAYNNHLNSQILSQFSFERHNVVVRNSLDLKIDEEKISYNKIDNEGKMNSFYEIPLAKQVYVLINKAELGPSQENEKNISKARIEYYNIDNQEKEFKILSSSEIKIDNKSKKDFDLVFGGGRGLSKDDFIRLRKIADYYNADLVGTRPCVDLGYIDYDEQVGQTGRSLTAKYYLAFGISGAIQHTIGLKNVDKIIAINSNKNANIFSYCDYAIVDDASKNLIEIYDVIYNEWLLYCKIRVYKT